MMFKFVAILCLPGLAHAVVTPFIFSPLNPTDRDLISFTTQTRFCEAVGGVQSIQILGDIIRVQTTGLVAVTSVFCVFGIRDVNISIGLIPAGSYQVELYILDGVGNGNFLVRTDPLTIITGPTPSFVQAPALSPFGTLLTILGFAAIASYAAKKNN